MIIGKTIHPRCLKVSIYKGCPEIHRTTSTYTLYYSYSLSVLYNLNLLCYNKRILFDSTTIFYLLSSSGISIFSMLEKFVNESVVSLGFSGNKESRAKILLEMREVYGDGCSSKSAIFVN